jgi:hypothetical protein
VKALFILTTINAGAFRKTLCQIELPHSGRADDRSILLSSADFHLLKELALLRPRFLV